MDRTSGHDLYTIMTQEWAKAPLEYLTATQHAIVSRFEESFRYVRLHPGNAKTFSYEFASILRDACSAFGSFSAALMRASNPTLGPEKNLNINDFLSFYSGYSPDLSKAYIEVRSIPGPCRLQPFWGWSEHTTPAWWKAHNNIKHSEYDHAREGNLQNATNAVAAVEIVLRCATQDQKGTTLFSPWGGPWGPGQRGTEHIQRLFDP